MLRDLKELFKGRKKVCEEEIHPSTLELRLASIPNTVTVKVNARLGGSYFSRYAKGREVSGFVKDKFTSTRGYKITTKFVVYEGVLTEAHYITLSDSKIVARLSDKELLGEPFDEVEISYEINKVDINFRC
ncbi:hypothetical protein HYX16_04045 [Candidatus Woesearchaeota archaeon]|nr:hypothetical protein [Candidatus Woesearchaeota archaeon]